MNLSTQLHFHNLQKVKNLEIKYNFMHRQCWGDFPAAVQDKYNDFCISKGLEPKTPSIKCGYLNDWIVYGETVEKAIENLEKLIDDLKNYQQQEREFFGDALIKSGKSSARKQWNYYQQQITGL